VYLEWAVRNRLGQVILGGIGSREAAESTAQVLGGVAVYRMISAWRDTDTDDGADDASVAVALRRQPTASSLDS
jgi:hypothetical protein